MTDEGNKVANMKVSELWEEAKRYTDSSNPNKKNDKFVNCDAIGSTLGVDCDEMPVLNPPCVREKGVTNARKKSYLEKKKRRKKCDHKFSISIDVESGKTEAPHNEGLPHSLLPVHPPLHSFGVPMHANIHNQTQGIGSICLEDNSTFSFTSMLQCDDQMLNLTQVSSSLGLESLNSEHEQFTLEKT